MPTTHLSTSRWVKCLSGDGSFRGVVIQATDLVQYMASLHGLEGPAAVALGEATIAALMVASYCKSGEKLNLNIKSSGQVRRAFVDADPQGKVRGYLHLNPHFRAEAPKTEFEKKDPLRIGPWETGLFSVLRSPEKLEPVGGRTQPFIGTVPLLTGYMAKDLTYYWYQSEQVPSAAGIDVEVDKQGKVISAGGFLVQAMPGAEESEVKKLETEIRSLGEFTAEFRGDLDPIQVLGRLFFDMTFMLLEERNLQFFCGCSTDRVQSAVALVGTSELKDMLKEKKNVEVICDFCAQNYSITTDAIQDMLKRSEAKK